MTGKVIKCDCCGVKHDFDCLPIAPDHAFRAEAAELGWTYSSERDQDFCPECS